MDSQTSHFDRNFSETLTAHERQERIHTNKIAALLVAVLMPAGVILDYFVYPDRVVLFLALRLICSVLTCGIWFLHTTRFGHKYYRLLGIPIALLPALFISIMIYATDGPVSSYYAGLNLIVLSISVVVRWNATESFIAISGVLLMYLVACLLGGKREQFPIIFNNYYFLILTGIIVIVGNHFFTQLRLREFASRFELDKSRKELEKTNYNLEVFNTKLAEQNVALDKANREIKETEMQLVQSEKMSSLGRFSAGLMHDILNPLNYSRTGLFVLRKKTRRLPPELLAETDAILNDIEDGLKRVDNIVSDLRTFTHPGVQASEDVDLADIFSMSLRFISSELRDKNISLKLDLEPGQKVWASRNHFILVVVNLLENAIDALGEKNFAEGTKPAIEISSRTEGERSLLFIHDNGPGIAAPNLAKIFDPFFTTKEVRRHGIGLEHLLWHCARLWRHHLRHERAGPVYRVHRGPACHRNCRRQNQT